MLKKIVKCIKMCRVFDIQVFGVLKYAFFLHIEVIDELVFTAKFFYNIDH